MNQNRNCKECLKELQESVLEMVFLHVQDGRLMLSLGEGIKHVFRKFKQEKIEYERQVKEMIRSTNGGYY